MCEDFSEDHFGFFYGDVGVSVGDVKGDKFVVWEHGGVFKVVQ